MNDEENYPTKEKEDIIATAGVIAFRGSSILLVRHDPATSNVVGFYGIPGGKLELGETEQSAAVREFNEETGLSPQAESLSEFEGNYVTADVARKNKTTQKMGFRVFRLYDIPGEFKATAKTTPVWLSFQQVEKLEKQNMLAQNTFRLVKAAINNV